MIDRTYARTHHDTTINRPFAGSCLRPPTATPLSNCCAAVALQQQRQDAGPRDLQLTPDYRPTKLYSYHTRSLSLGTLLPASVTATAITRLDVINYVSSHTASMAQPSQNVDWKVTGNFNLLKYTTPYLFNTTHILVLSGMNISLPMTKSLLLLF